MTPAVASGGLPWVYPRCSFMSCLCSGFGTSFVAMGHVSVLAQLYVLAPCVLWFLHSFQPPTCVSLPDRLSPCCLPEASLFGPPPFVCDLPLPIRVMVSRISVLSPVLPLALSLALTLALSLTLSLALSLTALALANLALTAVALAALALAALALASLALSDLALADLALADLDLADLVLAALVGGPSFG